MSVFLHRHASCLTGHVGYFVEDSTTSLSFLVLHVRDSVPNRSDDGSISCLVCVYIVYIYILNDTLCNHVSHETQIHTHV